MRKFDPAAHLAQIVGTYGRGSWGNRFMGWAYYDETVIHEIDADGRRIPSDLLVGGCLASQDRWLAFAEDWNKALADEDVQAFHGNDFYSFHSPFDWFTKDGQRDYMRHNAFCNRLNDLISHHVEHAIAFTSPISLKKGKLKTAYAHGAALAMRDAAKADDPLYLVLARHPELSQWSILKYFQNVDWEKKLLGCAVFDPKEVIPLQAADYILHLVNKSWGDERTASHARLAESFQKRGKTLIVQLGSTWTPEPSALKMLSG